MNTLTHPRLLLSRKFRLFTECWLENEQEKVIGCKKQKVREIRIVNRSSKRDK